MNGMSTLPLSWYVATWGKFSSYFRQCTISAPNFFFLCHHVRGLAITVSVRVKLQLFPYRLLNSTSWYSSLTFLYAWKHPNFNHVSRRRRSTLASIPMRKTLHPGKLRMPCDNCRCDIRGVYKLRKQRCPTVAYRQSTKHIQLHYARHYFSFDRLAPSGNVMNLCAPEGKGTNVQGG